MNQELPRLAGPTTIAVTVTRPHSPERWALLVPHRDRLIRIARGKLSDGHEAEDCVHDSLIRALGFAGLESERVGAFLTTVVVRLCADRHRARARDRSASCCRVQLPWLRVAAVNWATRCSTRYRSATGRSLEQL